MDVITYPLICFEHFRMESNMFTGLSMVCLVPFLVSAQQNFPPTSATRSLESPVAIRLSGQVASEYLRLVRSPRMSDAFLKDGCVTINGFADTIEGGTVRIHHVAFVRIVGEPVRLLRLESTIDANLVKHQQTVDASMFGSMPGVRVDLSDLHSAELRCSVMVGDFPNSRSYR